jgi:hypothetical protein
LNQLLNKYFIIYDEIEYLFHLNKKTKKKHKFYIYTCQNPIHQQFPHTKSSLFPFSQCPQYNLMKFLIPYLFNFLLCIPTCLFRISFQIIQTILIDCLRILPLLIYPILTLLPILISKFQPFIPFSWLNPHQFDTRLGLFQRVSISCHWIITMKLRLSQYLYTLAKNIGGFGELADWVEEVTVFSIYTIVDC